MSRQPGSITVVWHGSGSTVVHDLPIAPASSPHTRNTFVPSVLPGTSKWNKIEHCMFCHITANWRGRPLISRQVVVNLIGATTTREGLRIKAGIDENTYAKGIKVTDKVLAPSTYN